MADFEKSFQYLMEEEGVGLSNHKADKGGLTYAGIARKFHPTWAGWRIIDAGGTPPTELVRQFYREKFWEPIRADAINDQRVGEVIFSQFVNMGGTAIKLAQIVLGVIPDGQVGAKTLAALNAYDRDRFLDRYALAMLARYHAIGMKDKSQRTFWPGWFSRGLKVAS